MAELTILKALKGKINYPLPEDSYATALIEADMEADAPYTKSLKKNVELCAAELILVVCTSGDVKEGGFSISLKDIDKLMGIRNIYINNWPEVGAITSVPKVSAVKGKW